MSHSSARQRTGWRSPQTLAGHGIGENRTDARHFFENFLRDGRNHPARTWLSTERAAAKNGFMLYPTAVSSRKRNNLRVTGKLVSVKW